MQVHRLIVVVAALLCYLQCISGDEPDASARRRQRLGEMKRRATELKLGADARELKMIEDPLLRFDDPTRAFSDGTLWAWGNGGRPTALISIERYEKAWAYELISLSNDTLELQTPLGQTWRPKQPYVVEKSLPGARVSDAPAARRQQVRRLAQEFEMAEFVGPEDSRTVLRLFARPIYEYEDEESALVAGAIFVYANGTNPEILLLLEAKTDKTGMAVWKYGCAPLSTARLEAKLGEKVVWKSEKLVKYDFSQPYVAFALPLESEVSP